MPHGLKILAILYLKCQTRTDEPPDLSILNTDPEDILHEAINNKILFALDNPSISNTEEIENDNIVLKRICHIAETNFKHITKPVQEMEIGDNIFSNISAIIQNNTVCSENQELTQDEIG